MSDRVEVCVGCGESRREVNSERVCWSCDLDGDALWLVLAWLSALAASIVAVVKVAS